MAVPKKKRSLFKRKIRFSIYKKKKLKYLLNNNKYQVCFSCNSLVKNYHLCLICNKL